MLIEIKKENDKFAITITIENESDTIYYEDPDDAIMALKTATYIMVRILDSPAPTIV